GGDIDIAVPGLEHAGRDAGRVVVAGLARHFLGDEPARRLEIEHGDLCRQQRGLDILAFAGFLTLQQRDQNAHSAEDAGGEVGDGNADAHRALSRQPGDRHEPAHALGDLVEAGPVAIRTVLAEAGDAAIDQAWVDLLQALIVDLEAEFHVRAKVLDHDVGILRQPVQHLETFGILEVERDAALVAVQVLEIGAVPRAAEPAIALDRFDLDDLGAPIGELPYAGRAGA